MIRVWDHHELRAPAAQVIARATNFSRQVELINAASGGADTCVFVPPPQMGLGCKCALL